MKWSSNAVECFLKSICFCSLAYLWLSNKINNATVDEFNAFVYLSSFCNRCTWLVADNQNKGEFNSKNGRAAFSIEAATHSGRKSGIGRTHFSYFPAQVESESQSLIIAGTHGDETASIAGLSCALRSLPAANETRCDSVDEPRW